MSTWPPTLSDLKVDLKIDVGDVRNDGRLALDLSAAVTFVERVKSGQFLFDATDPDQVIAGLPLPDDDLFLGTLRLAGRWGSRRRSPDALIQMAELGSSRVPSFDTDIDRMLRLGRFAATEETGGFQFA